MIYLKKFEFNPFQVNSYVIYNENLDCIIVDPSNGEESEDKVLFEFIDKKDLQVRFIINTHGHVDHLLGLKVVKEKYRIPFMMHPDDIFLLEGAVDYGAVFGLSVKKPPAVDKELSHGETVELGKEKIEFIHVPGHSPGSLVLYVPSSNFIISGDVLFNGSIGRSDLPKGNYVQLIEGIKSKLMVLDPDCQVYPGHGPATSIRKEKESNPFLQ